MSKMPVNKKSVVCLETGESFNSLREAADIREVNLLSALRPENCLKVQTMRQSPLDAKLPI